jgi:hypothetical protein
MEIQIDDKHFKKLIRALINDYLIGNCSYDRFLDKDTILINRKKNIFALCLLKNKSRFVLVSIEYLAEFFSKNVNYLRFFESCYQYDGQLFDFMEGYEKWFLKTYKRINLEMAKRWMNENMDPN